jgi:hypothetical protein
MKEYVGLELQLHSFSTSGKKPQLHTEEEATWVPDNQTLRIIEKDPSPARSAQRLVRYQLSHAAASPVL